MCTTVNIAEISNIIENKGVRHRKGKKRPIPIVSPKELLANKSYSSK